MTDPLGQHARDPTVLAVSRYGTFWLDASARTRLPPATKSDLADRMREQLVDGTDTPAALTQWGSCRSGQPGLWEALARYPVKLQPCT